MIAIHIWHSAAVFARRNGEFHPFPPFFVYRSELFLLELVQALGNAGGRKLSPDNIFRCAEYRFGEFAYETEFLARPRILPYRARRVFPCSVLCGIRHCRICGRAKVFVFSAAIVDSRPRPSTRAVLRLPAHRHKFSDIFIASKRIDARKNLGRAHTHTSPKRLTIIPGDLEYYLIRICSPRRAAKHTIIKSSGRRCSGDEFVTTAS